MRRALFSHLIHLARGGPAGSLALLLALTLVLSACKGGGATPQPGGGDFTPGTLPEPQPVTTPYPALPDTAVWSQRGADQLRDYRVSVAGPDSLGEPQVQVCPGSFHCRAQVAAHGHIFTLAGRALLEVSQKGELLSSFPVLGIEDPQRADFAVSVLQLKLFVTAPGFVRAYDLLGKQLWETPLDPQRFSDPRLAVDRFDNITVASRDGLEKVAAAQFDDDGKLLRDTSEDAVAFSLGAVPITGDLLLLSRRDKLVEAIDNGALSWSAELKYPVQGNSVDGQWLWTSYDGHVYVLSPRQDSSGPHLQVFSPGGQALATLELQDDERLAASDYLGSSDGSFMLCNETSVFGFSGDGELSWKGEGAYAFIDSQQALPNGFFLLLAKAAGEQKFRLRLLGSQGQELWVSDLEPAAAAVVTPMGERSMLVSSGLGLSSIGADGKVQWRLANQLAWREQVFAAGGSLLARNDAGLASFDSAGHSLLRLDIPGGLLAQLLLLSDGTTLVGRTGELRALDAGGSGLWSKDLNVPFGGQSLLGGADGSVYVFGLLRRQVQVLDQGAVRWTYTDRNFVQDSGALDRLGNSYFFTYRAQDIPGNGTIGEIWQASWLSSLDRAGALRFARPLQARDAAGPFVCEDGAILAADEDGRLYWFGSDGAELARTGPAQYRQLLAPLADGALVSQLDPQVATYAVKLDRSGTEQWRSNLGQGFFVASAAVDGAGRCYLALQAQHQESSHVVCLDPAGSLVFETDLEPYTGLSDVTDLALGPDGSLAVLAGDILLRFMK